MTLRIRDGRRILSHPTIVASFDNGATWDVRQFCGYSHCTGECGFPALTIGNQRARGSMVAMGKVFEQMRAWTGDRVDVPVALQEGALKMWWN